MRYSVVCKSAATSASSAGWTGSLWKAPPTRRAFNPMSEMLANPLEMLGAFGPQHCEQLTVEQARAWCRRLAGRHYENFIVLSELGPANLRDDFAAVYAFCRWADDLGDESGSRERSLELLAWWRRELQQCFADEPRHPVFMALRPTIDRHDLPIDPF